MMQKNLFFFRDGTWSRFNHTKSTVLSLKETTSSGPFPLLNREAKPNTVENIIIWSLSKDMIPAFSIEDNEKTRDIKEDIFSHKLPHSISEEVLARALSFDDHVHLENIEPQEHQPLARDTWYGSSYEDCDISSKLSEPQEEVKLDLQPIVMHGERNIMMGKNCFQ
jgi:hypothetical protein